MWRPGRKIDICLRVRLDFVVDDFCVRTLAWRRPNREPERTARLEDAERLGAGTLRIGEMEQSEVGQDAIEAYVGKWKILRIAFLEFDLWKHFFCNRDHLFRKIQTGRDRAALYRCCGNIARTASHIQDRHPCGYFSGIKQWCNKLARRA